MGFSLKETYLISDVTALGGAGEKKIEIGWTAIGELSALHRNPHRRYPPLPSLPLTTMSAATATTATAAVPVLAMDDLLEQLALRNTADLAKIMKTAASLFEKAAKAAAKPARRAAKKSASVKSASVKSDASSGAKRGKQLEVHRAWVKYVLEDAKANGWKPFSVTESKKDKLTGEVATNTIELAASALVDGQYVFSDTKKPMIPRYAMTLSKLYWSVKEGNGLRQDLYLAFKGQYVPSSDTEATATEAETETEAEVEVPAPSAAATAAPKKRVTKAK
jgi:hypothetical protein